MLFIIIIIDFTLDLTCVLLEFWNKDQLMLHMTEDFFKLLLFNFFVCGVHQIYHWWEFLINFIEQSKKYSEKKPLFCMYFWLQYNVFLTTIQWIGHNVKYNRRTRLRSIRKVGYEIVWSTFKWLHHLLF